MSQIDTEAIRARCEAATPGPWKPDLSKLGIHKIVAQDAKGRWFQIGTSDKGHDAIFIAHARQDILALLDALETARSDRDCGHAGECEGCYIRQSECFSYHVFLAHKYEKQALHNACESDALKAKLEAAEKRAEDLELKLQHASEVGEVLLEAQREIMDGKRPVYQKGIECDRDRIKAELDALKSNPPIMLEGDSARSFMLALDLSETTQDRDRWKARAKAYESQAEMSTDEFDETEIPQEILDLLKDPKELARWVKRGAWHCKRVDEYARKIVPGLQARAEALERALLKTGIDGNGDSVPCRYCANAPTDMTSAKRCGACNVTYKVPTWTLPDWEFDQARFTERP